MIGCETNSARHGVSSMNRLLYDISSCLRIERYCHGLELPDYVFDNPSVQRIQDLAVELVVLFVSPQRDTSSQVS